MGVMIGLVVGYVMGTKSGEDGVQELKEAWATIRSSEEARDMVAGGLSIARSLLGRGSQMLAEHFQASGSSSAPVSALRPTG